MHANVQTSNLNATPRIIVTIAFLQSMALAACPPFCWWSYTRVNLLYASLLCLLATLHWWHFVKWVENANQKDFGNWSQADMLVMLVLDRTWEWYLDLIDAVSQFLRHFWHDDPLNCSTGSYRVLKSTSTLGQGKCHLREVLTTYHRAKHLNGVLLHFCCCLVWVLWLFFFLGRGTGDGCRTMRHRVFPH